MSDLKVHGKYFTPDSVHCGLEHPLLGCVVRTCHGCILARFGSHADTNMSAVKEDCTLQIPGTRRSCKAHCRSLKIGIGGGGGVPEGVVCTERGEAGLGLTGLGKVNSVVPLRISKLWKGHPALWERPQVPELQQYQKE